jgi:membrane associated rhomboid family serine protease
MVRYTLYQGKRNFLNNVLVNLSITNKLILINVILFIVSYFIVAVYGVEFFTNNFALTPSLILVGNNLWTFLTSMFLHSGFLHLFANMFSLFFIGNFLEKIIGKKRFLLVYLFSGILGGIFFVSSGFLFGSNLPGIGASGAIFGILGVLAVLVPYSKINLIIGPLVLILIGAIAEFVIPVNFLSVLNLIINILIIVMIFSLFSFNPSMRRFAVPLELPMWLLPIVAIVPLVIVGYFIDLPIGNSAHIGGLALGVVYGFYLKNKFPRKTKMLRRHFK